MYTLTILVMLITGSHLESPKSKTYDSLTQCVIEGKKSANRIQLELDNPDAQVDSFCKKKRG